MRRGRSIGIVVAGALLLAPAAAAPVELEADVLVAVSDMLLVRSSGGEQLFALEPGATVVGVESLQELQEGDRVRVSWSRERNGLKRAEAVEAAPVVGAAGDHAVPLASVPVAAGVPGRPLLVDVRGAASFASGHLPGAVSVPPERFDELARLVRSSGDMAAVFYGQHRGSREPIDALRRALALGIKNAGYLQGGVQGWVREGRPLAITPGAFAKGLGAEPFTVLDLRERERAVAGTVPGAISTPRSGLRSQDFADGRTLPVLVLLGEDSSDATPFAVAEQLRSWVEQGAYRRLPWILILEGGWKGWSAGGRKVARGPGVPDRLIFALGPGEIAREEFLALHAADPGPRGPLLLDVGDRGASAWEKRIPLVELVDRLGELPRDREIVAYCRVGKRAQVARAILVKNGYRARFLNASTAQ